MLKRHIALAIVLVLSLAFGGVAMAGDLTNSIVWDGQGSDSLRCDKLGESPERTEAGWIHWIVTQGSSVTQAQLVLGGSGSGTYAPTKYGPVIEFFTSYYDVGTLTATLNYEGALGATSQFVISDYCPGAKEELTVTKTADTSYIRTHEWSIDKSVATENGYTLDEYPKIWLDGPGTAGDETATWTVDVKYLGFKDTDHKVSGVIEIKNTGQIAADIQSIVDTLEYVPEDLSSEKTANVPVTCGGDKPVTFPYLLAVNETLKCTYSYALNDKATGTNTVKVTTLKAKYEASATMLWGDPTEEVNKTVTIKDVSDLFGEVELGTVTAPVGYTFTYYKPFAWADYQEACGEGFMYKNTATIVETNRSASAALKVNVRCEILEVSKSADTSYIRTHEWSIEKSVATQYGYTLDGYPKIWLYTDGSGDETATWTVDVTYQDFKDTDHKVSGVIEINNTGQLDAVITSVEDVLAGTPIVVDCDVEFPYTLSTTKSLICTYREAGYVAGKNEVTVTTERNKYYDVAAIVWGDPTEEVNKTVNIKDVSVLFGEKVLGTVTALVGYTFTYDKHFAWEDYGKDNCGHFEYDNEATIVETDRSASAILKVNVQCMVFKGETAWAANGNKPLEFRYTNRGNWATYVQYAEKCTTLFAGQTINVGEVCFSAVVENKVIIEVTMTAPWEFEDVSENLKVQDYAKAPSGNPAPGLFAHKDTCDAAGDTCSIVVPKNNFYGVHVNVGMWVPDPNFGSNGAYIGAVKAEEASSFIFLPTVTR